MADTAGGVRAPDGGGAGARARLVQARADAVRSEGVAHVEVHSHPWGDDVAFSGIDRSNDLEKFPYVAKKLPAIRTATMVCAPSGAIAAQTWHPVHQRIVPVAQLLFKGQRLLSQARVGVVGLGGNAAPYVQTMAHMGVRDFVLVDPDRIDGTSLNRLIGARPGDIGKHKVDIAKRTVRLLHADTQIQALPLTVFERDAVRHLCTVDLLVGATDSMAARLALCLLASRYMIPLVDTGVHVAGEHGALTDCFGQVRVAGPDGACLRCLGGVDLETAGQELLSSEEREVRLAMARAWLDRCRRWRR